jgi:hypothetical protein
MTHLLPASTSYLENQKSWLSPLRPACLFNLLASLRDLGGGFLSFHFPTSLRLAPALKRYTRFGFTYK